MLYYKIPEEYDNKYIGSHMLVGSELYTHKELQKLGIFDAVKKIAVPLEISKRRIYWLFGARFEI